MPSSTLLPFLVDHHAHTGEWSEDAAIPMRDLVTAVARRGLVPAVSDHWPADGWSRRGMADLDDLARYLDALDAVADVAGVPVLHGVEVAIGRDANRLDGRSFERLDHVVAGLHDPGPVPTGDRTEFLRRALGRIEAEIVAQPVDVLAHGTRDLYRHGEDPDDALPGWWQHELVEMLARHGVALEINGKSRHPHESLLRRALDAGVQLSVGSDVHYEHQLATAFDYPEAVIRRLGIRPGDLFDARVPKRERRSASRWLAALAEAVA